MLDAVVGFFFFFFIVYRIFLIKEFLTLTYKIKDKKDTHHAYIVQIDKYITKHTRQLL